MTPKFLAYLAIASTAWFVAVCIVGLKRSTDLSRSVGWYLLVFYLTYMLRPAGTNMLGDTTLYDFIKIGTADDHWQLMAFAVSLSIICFAIGYRIAIGRAGVDSLDLLSGEPRIVAADQIRKFMWVLLLWGYVLFVIGFGTGQVAGDAADVAGANMGEFKHNTAWLMQSDLFISTATTLYYILTGDLRKSLLLATPWLIERMIYGWGRNFIIGHFFALMAVYFLKARFRTHAAPKISQATVMVLAIIVIVLLFPVMGVLRTMRSQLHLSATSLSADVMTATSAGVSSQDMIETYFGTGSDISGFEETLYHLLTDRPQWGSTYLYDYFFLPIPRIIWPGKGSPLEWALWLHGIDWDPKVAKIGMTQGAIGMAYQQWGWPGVPIEFLFTGWFFGWLEERVRRKPQAAHLQVAYAGFFCSLPEVGRCSLLTLIAIKWLFPYGIPVFIMWRIYEAKLARDALSNPSQAAPEALQSA